MNKELANIENDGILIPADKIDYLQRELTNVRDEFSDNKYLIEAKKVLAVGGLRSTIGNYWNAVVDDLRRKIIHRSLDLFNKEIKPKKEIKCYEDFQNYTTEMELVEGAYKIGVIGWEDYKLLNQARETRNIFYGHPDSSDPTLFKVFNMIADCNKYVLSQPYPMPIIDTNEYILNMDSNNFSKNELAVEQALSDLPSIYKHELINKFYSLYQKDNTSTILKSNIEFCLPILWKVLPKEERQTIGKRVDKDFLLGNQIIMDSATNFMTIVEGMRYLSSATRKIIYDPYIKELEDNLDSWYAEGRAVSKIQELGNVLPDEFKPRLVTALTLSYIGYSGYYSFDASPKIASIFESFDMASAELFIETVKSNETLKSRVSNSRTLERLRNLANIILNNVQVKSHTHEFLELIADNSKTELLYRKIKKV